jgi:beta-fructofuranosidase
MRSFVFSLAFFSLQIIHAQSPEVHFTFNQSTGDVTVKEEVTGNVYNVINHFNRPEYIDAINGNALRLDGWSTYITAPNISVSGITRQLTVEAWYATEAFTKELSSILDLSGFNSGFHLSVSPFGQIVFGYFVDGVANTVMTPNKISKYQWHYIVAIVDLDEGTTKVYVDNELWFINNNQSGNAISVDNQPLFIGKRNLDQTTAGFSINTLNGAIDDIKIYSVALNAEALASHFAVAGNRSVELEIDPNDRFANDFLRPRFHPIPNAVWANECYGLIYYNNKYHLFFQKNPNGPYLFFMHWGHFTSPDLVNWKEERIALAPDSHPGFDNFGIWSGTATFAPDGTPRLLYTGVDSQKAGIGLAAPSDTSLLTWTKYVNNPVVANAPANSMDFRDIYVWKEGINYYMIAGSGIGGNAGGKVVLYKSTDLMSWTYLKPLFFDTHTSRSGVFWEMPFFHKLDSNTYILGVLPTPTAASGPAKVLYWLGKWQNETFTPYFQIPKKTEFIPENLLAPALGTDKDGNIVTIGIIPEDRSAASQVAAGWRQTFSIAREMRLLKDSTVGQIPHRNLCRLRGAGVELQNRSITAGSNFNFPEISGNQIEVELALKADSASIFSVQFFKHADGKELTSLIFNLSDNSISLDRSVSSLSGGLRNVRKESYIFDFSDTIRVRAFLDHSILEVFIDNVIVISCRVYPSRKESDNLDMVLKQGTVNVLSLSKWQMYDLGESSKEEVCIPVHLPSSLRKEKKVVQPPITTAVDREIRKAFALLPVPASTHLIVQQQGEWIAQFTLYSTTGIEVIRADISNFNNEIDISGLQSNIYLAKCTSQSSTQYFKVVVQH